MVEKKSGKNIFFDPDHHSTTEEPIIIPRSKDALEGDGWLTGMVHIIDLNRSDLLVIDTTLQNQLLLYTTISHQKSGSR